MRPAIQVQQLGKRYVVNHERQAGGYRTLRESLTDLAAAPWRRLRGQRSRTDEEFWALQDVSFDVPAGEVVGIIGRNGAGKSTLLKVLSRITKPTRGRVVIEGRVGSLLEVGTGFHPELTGRENIYLNGSILGMSRREISKKFDEIVAFAEIEQFLDTPVKRYSSGMYVRLAFAVAAHLEPEILIVDEVLAVGDTAFQKKCLARVGQMAQEGKTILLVSHNLPTVAALCTSAALLHNGTLLTRGKPHDVLRRYEQLGGSSSETHQHVSPYLRWKGLGNREQLSELAPEDDIVFKLCFETSGRKLEDVQVDIALFNDNGLQVVHARSPFVAPPFAVSPNRTIEINYSLRRPCLAPGKYLLTVYAYTGREVLCWVDNIDACFISARWKTHPHVLLSSLRGVIVPQFDVDLTASIPSLPHA
jgi:lipopolysaccharide transport system ATP-binding protein